MTDSQYSGCSPSTTATNLAKDLNPKFAAMKVARGERVKEDKVRREVERREAATVISSPAIRPADLSHYINSEFHSKREKSGSAIKGDTVELKREGKERPGQAQHP